MTIFHWSEEDNNVIIKMTYELIGDSHFIYNLNFEELDPGR